ncbi:MAG: hypothetical protein JST00_10965 [Deltaproteobacteria bacterium]|nr:hypothetical protein [Deltaproteobacteria bacterium]
MRTALVVTLSSCLFACSGSAETNSTEGIAATRQAVQVSPLAVGFAGCTEIASLAPAPVANVRPLVPARFTLTSGGPGLAILVVRIANCASVTVDGKSVGGGTVAQIGANLVSPDGTGDIDNYTLYYSTTSGLLANRLRSFGVPAQHVQNIDYVTALANGSGSIAIGVPRPMDAPYTVSGFIVAPAPQLVPFTANWWADDNGKSTRMQTPIAQIAFGAGNLTLTTSAQGNLGTIFGTGTVTFPYFDSYNTFGAATMTTAYVSF